MAELPDLGGGFNQTTAWDTSRPVCREVFCTAARLLAMLQFRGFVQQDATTRATFPDRSSAGWLSVSSAGWTYAPEPAWCWRSSMSTSRRPCTWAAWTQRRALHRLVESNRALRVGGRSGRSMPAHCSSNGKAQLATVSNDELWSLYPDEELPQLTPSSVSPRTQFQRSSLGCVRWATPPVTRKARKASARWPSRCPTPGATPRPDRLRADQPDDGAHPGRRPRPRVRSRRGDPSATALRAAVAGSSAPPPGTTTSSGDTPRCRPQNAERRDRVAGRLMAESEPAEGVANETQARRRECLPCRTYVLPAELFLDIYVGRQKV